jgi:hypothetical protein
VTRVWQFNENPDVLCAKAEDGSHTHSADVWSEVQVVPLDAIVIERAQMLTVEDVTTTDDGAIVDGDYNILGTVEHHTRRALINLALAEYRREHPPVSDELVTRLCERFASIDMPLTREQAIALARVGIVAEVAR